MNKKYLLIILLFVLLTSFSITDLFYKKTYVYKNITGKSENATTWLVKKTKNGFAITKTSELGITDILYSPKYKLKKMKYSSAKNQEAYEMKLEKNQLILNGNVKGKKSSKTYYLSEKWVQDFNFGLHNFLESKKSEMKFITINPDDFTKYQMVATRDSIHKLKIHDQVYNTQKVIVSLRGFKSLFWKAEIWYDLKSFDLIQYRANEGPGTPLKTTVMDSKK